MKPSRFSKLDAGDVFLSFHKEGSFFALVATDLDQNGLKFAAPFPKAPGQVRGPTLIPYQNQIVVSYGKEYILKLPCDAAGWTFESPDNKAPCILIDEDGVRYLRVSPPPRFPDDVDQPRCFVDIATGVIVSYGSEKFEALISPASTKAFVTEWELLTKETPPRLVAAVRDP